MTKIAIIFLGKRMGTIKVPWITKANWDEIAEKQNTEEADGNHPYRTEWRKVGNEYRIYFKKI